MSVPPQSEVNRPAALQGHEDSQNESSKSSRTESFAIASSDNLMPSRRWVMRGEPASSDPGARIGWPAGLPKSLAFVMQSRGIRTAEAAAEWFKPSLKSLRDPLTLKDMNLAIERIVRARKNQESIVLYGDYDLDGTSGLALALQAFREFGFEKVRGYQPQRLIEGYGLHSEAIARLKSECDCTLLISIDLGITAMAEVETARGLGVDVIVTDHHLPKHDDEGRVILPKAYAVVNPNRGDCESGLGHLCGTGVIFYLVLALRRVLLEEGLLLSAFDPKVLLDCFAIGTITDLVPLLHENRVLVKHGLVKLAETNRPGLQELLKALELWGRPLTAQDVAMRFAPKLNALSRMGSGIQPIDLYVEKDVARARELVSLVLTNNQDRQASQKAADDEAERLLKERPPNGAIVIASEKFHRGVLGLVATRFSQRYGLPAFIGAIEGEAGSIVGSSRVPNGAQTNLLDAMKAATNCLDQFGGHAVAAGFEAKRERFDEFRSIIENWYLKQGELPKEPSLEFDATCQFSELNSSFMAWHEHLGPFGAQAPIPLFKFEDCLVAQVRTLKGGHLRLKLAQPGAEAIQGIWFSPPVGAEPMVGTRVSVLAEIQWNHYQGSKTIQLMIQDVQIAARDLA
jgi:single-stranded-DNA-specific exonuclease